MKNIKVLVIVGILMVVVLAGIIILYYLGKGTENIGGEEDTHGCLIAAGYSWNDSIGACIREWELDSEDRRAAKIAIMPLSYYTTVVEVNKLDCEGCYDVRLQRNDNREIMDIKLDNWQINNSEGGNSEGKRTYCTAKQRGAQVCTMEYAPVCGWFDESIKCIKYPCAQTYSNACMACSEGTVAFWTPGECPK